jgi:hypothetical protein
VRIEVVFFMSDQKIALIFAVASSTRKIGGFIVQRRRLIVQSIAAGCIAVKETTKSRAFW